MMTKKSRKLPVEVGVGLLSQHTYWKTAIKKNYHDNKNRCLRINPQKEEKEDVDEEEEDVDKEEEDIDEEDVDEEEEDVDKEEEDVDEEELCVLTCVCFFGVKREGGESIIKNVKIYYIKSYITLKFLQ